MDRCLFVLSHDYKPRLGGVATCTYELARALHKNPHRVILIAPKMEGDEKFDQKQDFQTIRLDVPTSATKSVLKYKRLLKPLIEEHKPVHILNMLWHPTGIACLLLAKKSSIPYSIVAHGVEIMESTKTLKKKLRKSLSIVKQKAFQKAHAIFAVSEFTSRLVTNECRVPQKKITIMRNGVDPEIFHPGVPEGLENFSGKKVLLTVCRLVPHKGIANSIQAFAKVAERHPELVYLIGGTGPEKEKLKEKVRELKLEERVQFLGPVPFKKLRNYYKLCDIYIMLSKIDEDLPAVEGFGIAFLEAGACEKPVIAGKSGGTRSAVEDDVTGFLVAPEDVLGAAEKIDFLLNNPEEAQKMGKAARERILRELNWPKIAEKVTENLF